MKPQTFSELRPRVVLAIAAHPDDIDFAASGTLASFAAQGADVYYLQLTDGSKGSSDPHATPEQVSQLRSDEQRHACQCIGGKEVFFLNHPDGELEATMDLKREVVRYIRQLKPDVVITTEPMTLYYKEWGIINHTDHRVAGQVAVDAVYPLARDRLSFPEHSEEGLEPHKVKTVLLTTFSDQNFFVDVSNVFEQKMAAISAHASQITNHEEFTETLANMAAENGKRLGVAYAEGFIRLDMMP